MGRFCRRERLDQLPKVLRSLHRSSGVAHMRTSSSSAEAVDIPACCSICISRSPRHAEGLLAVSVDYRPLASATIAMQTAASSVHQPRIQLSEAGFRDAPSITPLSPLAPYLSASVRLDNSSSVANTAASRHLR